MEVAEQRALEGADGSSLVYCAPTSGGKSLVANVLLVRRLVRRMRSGRPARALVVLPFHSLVNEKVEDLKTINKVIKEAKDTAEVCLKIVPIKGPAAVAVSFRAGLKSLADAVPCEQFATSLRLAQPVAGEQPGSGTGAARGFLLPVVPIP